MSEKTPLFIGFRYQRVDLSSRYLLKGCLIIRRSLGLGIWVGSASITLYDEICTDYGLVIILAACQ